MRTKQPFGIPIIFALLFLLLPSILLADNKSISYEQLLELAVLNSPQIKQLEASVAMQRAEALALTTATNPELSTEVRPYSGDADGRDIEYEISLSQQFKPGTLGARARVARLINSLSDIQARLNVIQFSQSLLLGYSKVWAIQEGKQFLIVLSRRLKEINQKAKKAELSGHLPTSSLRILESQNKKINIDLDGLDGDLSRAKAELLAKCGSLPENATFTEPIPEVLPENALIANPTSSFKDRILISTELSREQEKLARLDAFPRFAPRIAFEHTADGDDRINIGFAMDLPFSERNQAEIFKSNAEKNVREAEAKYLDAGSLQQELTLILESAKKTRNQASRIKNELLPLLENAYQSAQRGIDSGQASPLQLSQIIAELEETQNRYLELWIKALASQVELSVMLGN